MSVRILHGDCRQVLDTLPEASVQCCVTSPPYWGLRSYLPTDHPLKALEIGSEPTVDEWVTTMVDVLRRVRRVLRDDGVLFLNLGDSYHGGGRGGEYSGSTLNDRQTNHSHQAFTAAQRNASAAAGRARPTNGLKPKDMVGQPWLAAFALRADGWWLRQEIIWSKANPMPESARDRCTKSHEHIFLLSKSERYFWNFKAVQEPVSGTAHARKSRGGETGVGFGHGYDEDKKPRYTSNVGRRDAPPGNPPESQRKMAAGRVEGIKNNATFVDVTSGELRDERNPRSVWIADEDEYQQFLAWKAEQTVSPDVWTFPTEAFKGAHFATFPQELARRCITAGTREGDTVLDPFGGSGTVGMVADGMQRHAILIDLDERNVPMARGRVEGDAPLFAEVATT